MKAILHVVLPLALTLGATAQKSSYEVSGKACWGSNEAQPVIANQGLPTIGTTLRINLTKGFWNIPVMMTLGNNLDSWGALKLPVDLAVINSRGCFVYTNPAITFTSVTDNKGNASFPLPIPNDESLVGTKFFNQFWLFDKGANPGGIVTSAVGKATVGKS